MRSIVGIFETGQAAEKAGEALRRDAGLAAEHVQVLTPASSESQIHSSVETSETEQPGMGKAVGGVVGGVMGGTAGMGLGAAAASLLVPGVGPILAAELAAGALLGAGGVLAGAAAGGALEGSMSHGLPKDELYLYEDALRHGRSVVFALAKDGEQAELARRELERAGSESLDAARERWWVGIRDPEKEHYEAQGGDFSAAEPVYRKGFEAALHPDRRGKSYAESRATLAESYREVAHHEAFRRGYERGLAWADSSLASGRPAGARAEAEPRAPRSPSGGARRGSIREE